MKKKKIRNPIAIPAKSRSAAGPMRNKKDKRKNKKKEIEEQIANACRFRA